MADRSHDFSGQAVIPAAAVMMSLSTLAVIFRFMSRRLTKVPLWWDDWLILAALPFSWFECIVDIGGILDYGFGTHIDTFATQAQLHLFFGITYADQIAYCIGVTLPKFSMLAMYWRLFGLNSFRWPLIGTAVVTMMYLIASTLVAIFSCIPVQGFWDVTIKAKCVNQLQFYIGQAVATILLDLVLLCLPVFPVLRLQVSNAQKIGLVAIFGLGILVTISSAVRLSALVKTQTVPGAAMDASYTLVDGSIWSFVETNLSVVCACLPSMRPLLRMAMSGKIYSSNNSHGRQTYGSNISSTNRTSAYGGASQSKPGGLKRSSQWRRVNSIRGSGEPGNPSFQLNKLSAAVSVRGLGDQRERDVWGAIPEVQTTIYAGEESPKGEQRYSGNRREGWTSPTERTRGKSDGEESMRRFLRRPSRDAIRENASSDDLEGGAAEKEDGGGHEIKDPDTTGPMRLDEYEIRSESAETVARPENAFGYSYEITAGRSEEEEGVSGGSEDHPERKVWDGVGRNS